MTHIQGIIDKLEEQLSYLHTMRPHRESMVDGSLYSAENKLRESINFLRLAIKDADLLTKLKAGQEQS